MPYELTQFMNPLFYQKTKCSSPSWCVIQSVYVYVLPRTKERKKKRDRGGIIQFASVHFFRDTRRSTNTNPYLLPASDTMCLLTCAYGRRRRSRHLQNLPQVSLFRLGTTLRTNAVVAFPAGTQLVSCTARRSYHVTPATSYHESSVLPKLQRKQGPLCMAHSSGHAVAHWLVVVTNHPRVCASSHGKAESHHCY